MTPLVPTVLIVTKTLILVGFGLYTIFAFVIVRQEQLMAQVLKESFEPILRLLTIVHLLLAIGTLLLALLLL